MSRAGATIRVYCDYCELEEEIYLVELANGDYDAKNVDYKLIRYGWILDKENHFCSQKCKDEYEKWNKKGVK
jgi:hypothetical protein